MEAASHPATVLDDYVRVLINKCISDAIVT